MDESRRACPAQVLDWIAWYPEGDLPAGVRGAIEAHAAECAACRREIALAHGEHVEAAGPLPAPDQLFARVLERVEAEARGAEAAAAPSARRGLRWSLPTVAVGALFAGVLGGVALNVRGGPAPFASARAATPGADLEVVFRPDLPYDRMQQLLRELDASVVGGPGAGGAVRLRLHSGARAADVAARLLAEPGSPALYAQPVAP